MQIISRNTREFIALSEIIIIIIITKIYIAHMPDGKING